MQGLLFTDYALAMFGNLSVFHLKNNRNTICICDKFQKTIGRVSSCRLPFREAERYVLLKRVKEVFNPVFP